MMRVGLVALSCFLGCARSPAPHTSAPLEDGLAIAVETHVREIDHERVLLAVDGEVQTGRVLRFAALPSGEHTIQARIDASFACGLGTEPRGMVTVKTARTFILDDRPAAHVVLALEERSMTRPIQERLATRWTVRGSGISEADGCDFGPSVTVSGCDLPEPPRANDAMSRREGEVLVLGEVKKPGRMTSWSVPTLAHAVCRAGGATVFASRRARVRRDRRSFIASWQEEEARVALEPGDVVFVEPICAGY
jgi:hypothetical protein